jgi:SAM-dependent methyltransferase
MPTPGELTYFSAIGEMGREHARNKPFSDDNRAAVLMEVGAILAVLPPPPAKVLDCGCGTGWLARLLQRSGYEATGVDVASDAIELAGAGTGPTADPAPRFVVAEAEALPFEGEFDAVVFFDALHHAVDEEAALRAVLRALRPGGVCVTSEPGSGHAEASHEQVEAFGVTERDMPAHHIAAVGRRVGFVDARIYPRADDLRTRLYPCTDEGGDWRSRLRGNPLVRAALTLRTTELRKRDNGIVVLTAPG